MSIRDKLKQMRDKREVAAQTSEFQDVVDAVSKLNAVMAAYDPAKAGTGNEEYLKCAAAVDALIKERWAMREYVLKRYHEWKERKENVKLEPFEAFKREPWAAAAVTMDKTAPYEKACEDKKYELKSTCTFTPSQTRMTKIYTHDKGTYASMGGSDERYAEHSSRPVAWWLMKNGYDVVLRRVKRPSTLPGHTITEYELWTNIDEAWAFEVIDTWVPLNVRCRIWGAVQLHPQVYMPMGYMIDCIKNPVWNDPEYRFTVKKVGTLG